MYWVMAYRFDGDWGDVGRYESKREAAKIARRVAGEPGIKETRIYKGTWQGFDQHKDPVETFYPES